MEAWTWYSSGGWATIKKRDHPLPSFPETTSRDLAVAATPLRTQVRDLDDITFTEWFHELRQRPSRSIDRMWDPIAYALGFIDCDHISATVHAHHLHVVRDSHRSFGFADARRFSADLSP